MRLVLTGFERTRELGMLRTIGMTRRQARRMIRHGSVITALVGAALGRPLGIFLAQLVTQALSQYTSPLALSWLRDGTRHGGRHGSGVGVRLGREGAGCRSLRRPAQLLREVPRALAEELHDCGAGWRG
jgi:FtsX-like permease family